MKNRGLLYLSAFGVLILAVGLACSILSSTPTAEPVSNPPTEAVQATPSDVSSTGDLVTFTDKNDYYEIDVPADWKHEQSTIDNGYIDTFTSPDGAAVIENIAYDDGTAWTGQQAGKAALKLLNENYSSTSKEGDIRVSDDSIQKDGSERLTWTSKGGGYSGYSYFEVRNKTTFLMFTVDWGNDQKDAYIDILNNVVSSYRLP